MGCSSSQTAPEWVPSTGCSPSGTDCSSMGPPLGSQILPGNLLQNGLLSLRVHGCFPLGIHVLWHGLFPRLQLGICSTVDLHGLQGDSLPHHGLFHRLQGNVFSGAWTTSSPSFFNELGVCRVLTPLSSCKNALTQFVFLLNYVVPEALPMLLMGLALASSGSVLEPSGIVLLDIREASSSFSQKPPLWPSYYQNLAMQTQNNVKYHYPLLGYEAGLYDLERSIQLCFSLTLHRKINAKYSQCYLK